MATCKDLKHTAKSQTVMAAWPGQNVSKNNRSCGALLVCSGHNLPRVSQGGKTGNLTTGSWVLKMNWWMWGVCRSAAVGKSSVHSDTYIRSVVPTAPYGGNKAADQSEFPCWLHCQKHLLKPEQNWSSGKRWLGMNILLLDPTAAHSSFYV